MSAHNNWVEASTSRKQIPRTNANAPVTRILPENHGTNVSVFPGYSAIPSHVVKDAVRMMSVPVGTYPDDEAILAKALADGARNHLTHKQAIETIHGVNDHSAMSWKDYYLDHMARLDCLVKLLSPTTASSPTRTVKKPAFIIPTVPEIPSIPAVCHRLDSISPREMGDQSRKRKGKEIQRERTAKEAITHSRIEDPKRRITNDVLTGTSGYARSLSPVPNTKIATPRLPSRSPSPPTQVIPVTHGNKFTKKDKEYFLQFLSWHKNRDPSLTKHEICTMLAKKVPSHSVKSWHSHWSSRHAVADKIVLEAEGELDEEVSYNGAGSSGKFREDDDEEDGGGDESSEADLSPWVETDEEDFGHMGNPGDPLTAADYRAMVKHIASTDSFHEMTGEKRWEGFVGVVRTLSHICNPQAEKIPPKKNRTENSWRNHYDRRSKTILRMVRQYEQFLDIQNERNWAESEQMGPQQKRARFA